ncbi:MAG: hypothetical protein WA790_02540 [Sulfitobacter sp.]
MNQITPRGPLGQKERKQPLPLNKPRKQMRRKSKKRTTYEASPEGKAAMEWMGRVKQLPCCICGHPAPSDAHHVFHGRYSSAKESGFDTIPLCKAHHQDGPEAIHNGKKTWAGKHGFDYEYLPDVSAQLGEINF